MCLSGGEEGQRAADAGSISVQRTAPLPCCACAGGGLAVPRDCGRMLNHRSVQ